MDTTTHTRFYVTFPIGGALRHNYAVIDAPDEDAARLQIIATYGTGGFAGVYREHERAVAIDKYRLTEVEFGVGRYASIPSDAAPGTGPQ